jgi:hypothetical protein
MLAVKYAADQSIPWPNPRKATVDVNATAFRTVTRWLRKFVRIVTHEGN